MSSRGIPEIETSKGRLFKSLSDNYTGSGIIEFPESGIWNIRMLVLDNTRSIWSESQEIDVTIITKNISNSGTRMFSPPQVGNTNGRIYLFDNKKWIYQEKSKLWERDYTYLTTEINESNENIPRYKSNVSKQAEDISKKYF